MELFEQDSLTESSMKDSATYAGRLELHFISQYYIKVGCFAKCNGHQSNLLSHSITDDIKAKDKTFAEDVKVL